MNDKALVIGGARDRSIGSAIADKLNRSGWGVITPTHAELDVTRNASSFMGLLFDDQHNALPRALVLSHGVTSMGPFQEQSQDDVYQVIGTNLIGSILAAQAFVREWMARPGAVRAGRLKIVFIGSLGGSRVFTNSSIYCASKAGIRHLVECMAWELGHAGIDVFGVNPGNVQSTNLSDFVAEGMGEDAYKFDQHKVRDRIVTREEVAAIASQLVTDDNFSYLSGSNIDLPGGDR